MVVPIAKVLGDKFAVNVLFEACSKLYDRVALAVLLPSKTEVVLIVTPLVVPNDPTFAVPVTFRPAAAVNRPLTPKVLSALAAPPMPNVDCTLPAPVTNSVPTLMYEPLTVVVPIVNVLGDRLAVAVLFDA